MKKINKLNQKLKKIEELEVQIKKFKSLSKIPTIKFVMYKHGKIKKKKICKEIEKIKRFGKGVELLYRYETQNWIQNPNINCRKYERLEEKARYRRDLKLYKLGFNREKPKSIFKQRISKFIPKINISGNFIIKKIQSNLKNFKSSVLPKKTNKIAVNTAKKVIKGYRSIRTRCRYFKNNMSKNNSIKYLQGIVKEARRELKNEECLGNLENNLYTEEGRSFRERLRFDQKKNIKVYTADYRVNNKNKGITVKSNNIAMEYDL